MAVLMTNTQLGVRRRVDAGYDGHGELAPPSWDPVEGPWPGRAAENADESWTLGVDPAGWPLREHDLVAEPDTGREWLVQTADLLHNNLDPSVDYIRVQAMERTPGGDTETTLGAR